METWRGERLTITVENTREYAASLLASGWRRRHVVEHLCNLGAVYEGRKRRVYEQVANELEAQA